MVNEIIGGLLVCFLICYVGLFLWLTKEDKDD